MQAWRCKDFLSFADQKAMVDAFLRFIWRKKTLEIAQEFHPNAVEYKQYLKTIRSHLRKNDKFLLKMFDMCKLFSAETT